MDAVLQRARVTSSRRTTRTSTTVAAFASLAMAALGNPASAAGQQGQGWPIKEFEVVAVEPAGDVDVEPTGHVGGDKVLRGLAGLVEEMMRTIRTETNYDPDFPLIWDEPTVSFDGIEETKAEIETVLEEAAAKLESWGFPSPWLEPVVENKYRVYLVTGRPYAGAYHQQPCSHGFREDVLVLNADAVLGSDGSLTDFGVESAVHELVHSTQWPHASYSCGKGGQWIGKPGQWIGEGTADAIGWDVAEQLRGLAVFRNRWAGAWGARMYSEQLPVPGHTGTRRAYRSLSFWRFLAEYTHSRPKFPDGSAFLTRDYSYLPRLLGRDFSPRDCYDEGAPCDAELRWIDAGLRAEFGLPLRELYARFVQAYAQYGEERVHSTEGGTEADWRKNWLAASFAGEEGTGCPEVVLGPEADKRQKKFTVARFADVAARCWEVELDGFKEEENVILAVTASYRPGTEALLEQLTAVMADQSGRVDKAQVRTVADVPEATWYYDHLGAADSTVFLLTNVADQPDATRGLTNLSVTFTAVNSFARITSGPGPSAADVDQPLGVRFERNLKGVVSDMTETLYERDPGLAQPCLLAVPGLSNARGDALTFFMDHEGPIGPGDYPVTDATRDPFGYRGAKGGPTAPPGAAVVNFTLGFLNQPPAQQLQNFVGVAGTLTVELVARRFVMGVLNVVGENSIAEDIARDWKKPPANYLPGAAIRVEFGLMMQDPSDPVRHRGATDCLTSKPGAHKTGSGNGGTPTGSPDPSSDDPGPPADEGPPSESEAGSGLPSDRSREPGVEPAEDRGNEAEDTARPSEAATGQLGPGKTRWVRVWARDRPDLSFSGSDLDGSAGATFTCWTGNPVNISLYEGDSARNATLGVTLITTPNIPEGATGTYRIDQVLYVFQGGALGWRGPVTLELTRHDASTDPGARRVAGRILGLRVVDRTTDALIPIEAEFDVNAACAPFGR